MSLGEIALVPATGGIFTIDIVHSPLPSSTAETDSKENGLLKTQTTQLWDRKTHGGFPGNFLQLSTCPICNAYIPHAR